VSGVQPGDVVVMEGSFFVRAERERLGLRPPAAAPPATPSRVPAATSREDADATVQNVKIIVNEQCYEPAKITLRPGVPARLTFLRTTDKTSGTEVVFPSLNIKRALPLNEAVVVEFRPAKSGDIAFACGMNMLHGTLVVQ
jgi:plastocyanin domain-containing protein